MDIVQTLNEISQNIDGIRKSLGIMENNKWEISSTAATFFAVVVAFLMGSKEEIKNWLRKPDVELKEKTLSSNQGAKKEIFVTRFIVENKGKGVAKNVSFVIGELYYSEDGKKNNWKNEKKFVPFPIGWTHSAKEEKDLYINRPYYLDFFQNCYNCNKQTGIFSPQGIPRSHGLPDIEKGWNKLLLTMYCENSKSKKYWVRIFWNGEFKEPDKIEIEKI